MPSPTPSTYTIAVSGHRALHPDDAVRARAQLSALLAQIAQALPARPLACLSALAAGADQLFAEQVLALQAQLGAQRVRLLVALPMPEAAYIESQEAPGADAFRPGYLALRARAQAVFEVNAHGEPLTGSAPYERLGDYFAETADLLVALWDGDTGAARQPGGTFDVVMRYLAAPHRPLARAVLHVPVRRAGSDDGAAGAAVQALPALLTMDGAGGLQRSEAKAALVHYLDGR
jgi:hypothetical protein